MARRYHTLRLSSVRSPRLIYMLENITIDESPENVLALPENPNVKIDTKIRKIGLGDRFRHSALSFSWRQYEAFSAIEIEAISITTASITRIVMIFTPISAQMPFSSHVTISAAVPNIRLMKNIVHLLP